MDIQSFSVSQYLDFINIVLGKTAEAPIKVVGEISSCSDHPTGLYVTLQDSEDKAVMECYMSRWSYKSLGMPLETGMQVALLGRPSIYKPRGRFSFQIDAVELVGEGALKKAYDLLKMKLDSEGLFARKREIPEFIKSIGVISSRTGAVIDDFRNNLEKYGYKIYFKDCRVEGAKAAEQLIECIHYFNASKLDLDCLVVMRGGGSLEDLQAFNNELVVRELFASKIPTIAAIGHDRDVPLACLTADSYTSTPTAAAMQINASWDRLHEQVSIMTERLINFAQTRIDTITSQIELSTHQFINFYRELKEYITNLDQRLYTGLEKTRAAIASSKTTITSIERFLDQANPLRQLKLGYALAYAGNKLIRSIKELRIDQSLDITVNDGSINATINKISND